MGDTLYEDEYVELKDDFLIIKRYFFPMLKPKTVYVKDIRVVYFDEQDNSKYGICRTFGKTNNETYWAVDVRRCLPGDKSGKYNVIIDIEDGLKKGFTVRDIQTFLQSLRVVANMSLIVVDNLDI